MPVPLRIAILARHCLARFRLPTELKRRSRSPPRSDAPICCEPSVDGGAPEGPRRRRAIADDASSADGRRRSRSVLAPPFPSRISRPGTRSYRVMPPLFPSICNGFEVVGDGDKRNHAARQYRKRSQPEEGCSSHHSERAQSDEEYLQSIAQKCGEQDPPEGVLSVSLHKHQRMGLNWMLFRENSSHCAGGILADEQGIGKTMVVIALILKQMPQQSKFKCTYSDRAAIVADKELKDEPQKNLGLFARLKRFLFRQKPASHAPNVERCAVDRISSSVSTLRSTYTAKPAGGTLIVCPKSILTQWDEEFSHKVTEDAGLSVLIYHGYRCSRTIGPEDLAKPDVVLTTYGVVKKQFLSREKGSVKKPSASGGHNSKAVFEVRWFRIVLDEAHEIRNRKSLVAESCWELQAERRWCISGTPMQNKFVDLYSYLCFLRYIPYSEYSSFRSLLKKQNGKKEVEILLGTVLLRRTKETCIDGEPIIKLPQMTIQTIKKKFTPEEEFFYRCLEGCHWKELLLACDHSCLVISQSENHPYSTIFERSYVSSKMNSIIDILNSTVNKHTNTESDSNTESSSIESTPEKALVFSQFTMVLDLLEPSLKTNGIQFRRLDGVMDCQARDKAVEDFKTNPEVTVLLVSLMSGSVGLNLVAASHVIIVDPWWNPFVEDQAIGRAHRIGQTRPVIVYRLVVEDTIEERIIDVQRTKRMMVRSVFDGSIFREKASEEELSEEERKFLFG